MKSDQDEKRWIFFQKNVSGPSNPPDELTQHVSKKKKKPFGRIIFPFFFESSESDRFFNYLHDSNSIFRVGRINSENISARTVRATGAAPTFRFNNIHLCYRPSRKFLYQNFNVSFVDVFRRVGRAVSKGRAFPVH